MALGSRLDARSSAVSQRADSRLCCRPARMRARSRLALELRREASSFRATGVDGSPYREGRYITRTRVLYAGRRASRKPWTDRVRWERLARPHTSKVTGQLTAQLVLRQAILSRGLWADGVADRPSPYVSCHSPNLPPHGTEDETRRRHREAYFQPVLYLTPTSPTVSPQLQHTLRRNSCRQPASDRLIPVTARALSSPPGQNCLASVAGIFPRNPIECNDNRLLLTCIL